MAKRLLFPIAIVWAILWVLVALLEIMPFLHRADVPSWLPVAMIAPSALAVLAWTFFWLRSDARLGAMPLLVVLSASQGHAQQDLCRGACIAKIAAASTRATGPVFIAGSTHGSLVIGKQEAAVAAKIIAFARALP